MTIFDEQIRAFRAWMKDRGQQNKPLIVSEYGVLYRHIAEADTAQEVQDFMINTFDYFLNTQDCSLGYAADQCRLVQRWNWYSFNDNGQSNGFNPYAQPVRPSDFPDHEHGRAVPRVFTQEHRRAQSIAGDCPCHPMGQTTGGSYRADMRDGRLRLLRTRPVFA